MFRIQIHRETGATSFSIEGKLAGASVTELERCWRDEGSAEASRRIVVNLAAVSFVDAGGRDLLGRMRSQGATLQARGCLMKSIVQEIESSIDSQNRR